MAPIPTTLFGMASKLSNSTFYRQRAAICAWCAEEAISAETAAELMSLEEMWLVVTEVVDLIERNGSRSALDSDRDHYVEGFRRAGLEQL